MKVRTTRAFSLVPPQFKCLISYKIFSRWSMLILTKAHSSLFSRYALSLDTTTVIARLGARVWDDECGTQNASITAYPMGFELACPTGMYLVNFCCPLPNLPALGMRAGISFEPCGYKLPGTVRQRTIIVFQPYGSPSFALQSSVYFPLHFR